MLSDEAGLQYVNVSDFRSMASTEVVNTMQFRFESGSRAVLYVLLPTTTASDLSSISCRKSLSSLLVQSEKCPGSRAILPSMVAAAIAMQRIVSLYPARCIRRRLPVQCGLYGRLERARYQENTHCARGLPRVAFCRKYPRSQDHAIHPRAPCIGGGFLIPLRISHDRRRRRSLWQTHGEALRLGRIHPASPLRCLFAALSCLAVGCGGGVGP